MHPDQAPEAGKFRAVASANLDGEVGVWGNADMLCVSVDSNGELDFGTATNCIGVIWTKEGRRPGLDGVVPNAVIGGDKYTVFMRAEFVETEVGSSPTLAAGDELYATSTAGDIALSAAGAGAIWLGVVLADKQGNGNRLMLDVGGRSVGIGTT